MQDAEHSHLRLSVESLVDCNERERRKRDLTCAGNPTGTPEQWERFQCPDAFDDRLRDLASRLGTALSDGR